MALLAGLFSGAAAPTFAEREPWERGFAQIFAHDVAPGLARLERRRRLSLLAILLIVAAALLMTGLVIAKAPKGLAGQLATLPGIAALLAGSLMASRFKAREERLFLPAVCRQFGPVQVEVAPKGATLSALDPYWNRGLIPRPDQRSRKVKLNVGELFTGERRGIGLSLVGIEVSRGSAIIGVDETLYRDDVVELALPDPGPGRKYGSWHSYATSLTGAGSATESRGLQTPQVTQALAELRKVFVPESIAVAVSENRLYLALSSSKQGRRIGRIGVFTPVHRCEPAIRAALAQLAAVLRLVDAVADACGQPAAQSLWAGDAAGAPAPAAAIVGSALRPLRLALRVLGVLVVGTALIVGIFLIYIQHLNAQTVARVREAAEHGDAAAQNTLANLYRTGRGVARDYGEAMRWYRKAADQGYADAEDNLGLSYEWGLGGAPDYAEAMRWYHNAAARNYPDAETNIGNLYWNGRGVPQDTEEALRWYRMAADQGYAPAQNSIGNLYANDSGVARDYGEAMRWYRKAADQGFAQARNTIGNLYANGSGVGQNYFEAMGWYRMAADQGLARAQFHIGNLYANGWGVPGDPGEARKWMQKAADGGEQDAKKWLSAQ